MDKLAEKMAELAERLGPQVIDAARGAVRVEAYSSMMASAMCLAACAGLFFFGRFLWSRRDPKEDVDGYAIASCLAWVIALIMVFPALWGFLDPWVYAAINHPDLWLAKKVFKL